MIGPEEISELCPIVNLDGILGGAWIPTDGHIDPSSVTNALAAGARARGVDIERNTRVTGLRPRPDGGWDVETSVGVIESEIVVNAAGMWAPRIAAMAGTSLPIVPLEHEFVVTGPVPRLAELAREIPVIRDPEASFYVRAEGDGLIVGPFEPGTEAWAVEGVPWEFESRLLEPDIDRIQEILLLAAHRFPAFEDAGIGRVVNGPDGYTPGPLGERHRDVGQVGATLVGHPGGRVESSYPTSRVLQARPRLRRCSCLRSWTISRTTATKGFPSSSRYPVKP